MTKAWDEVRAEHEEYLQTRRFKIDQMIYKVRLFLTSPLRWRYNIRHWYQRARYGYSDRDCWSGDYHIAGIIAGVMDKIVKDGHGVAISYADDWDTSVDVMVERRDAEWGKYIEVFREYSENGPAINQKWKDEFGGVLDEDMQDALEWLSKHFQELWD